MTKILSVFAILTLAAALLPVAFGQSSQSNPSSMPQAQPSSSSQTSQSGSMADESSTFRGTVEKVNGKYCLKTDAGTYQLTDQSTVKKYEGKEVTVRGTLDSNTSMLHVTHITLKVTPSR
jgi:lipopolysaccharide export system protein LptA